MATVHALVAQATARVAIKRLIGVSVSAPAAFEFQQWHAARDGSRDQSAKLVRSRSFVKQAITHKVDQILDFMFAQRRRP